MSKELTDFSYFGKRNARERGNHVACTFSNGEQELARLSFADLDLAARAGAAALQELDVFQRPVLLLLDSALDFVRAFNACLYANAIAVPVNLPTNQQRMQKVQSLARDSGARVVITTGRLAAQLAAEGCDLHTLELSTSLSDQLSAANCYREVKPASEGLAFLQYTSGSTGAPKGVMVSHANLIANQAMIAAAFRHDDETVFASWLPLFHDMGLVGVMLQTAYLGVRCAFMPPLAFVHQPARWLKLISSNRATTSGAPNFAYELCVRRIDPAQLEGVDLSSWKLAFNGAEPVHAGTLDRFAEKFAAFGFSPRSHYPCYGMAEATLFISGRPESEPPRTCEVSSAGLDRGDVRGEGPRQAKDTRVVVSCGKGWLGERIVIVDPQTCEELQPGQVGEIWVAGANIAIGYWNNEEASRQTFQAYTRGGLGPFLRTGDLGFTRSGELFVTGRIRDLIIVAGRNHYPQDVELTVRSAHPAMAGRVGATFSLSDGQAEEVFVVQEVNLRAARLLGEQQLASCTRDAVMSEHGLALKRVVFIAPGKLPLTTSGKVQRSRCRALLLAGEFNSVFSSVTQLADVAEV